MPWFRADLHNHSCLSPCGELEMGPGDIVDRARALGIDLLALSDHNCTANLPCFAHHAKRASQSVLYGTELTSAEEAHCLCLFGDLGAALDFGKLVEAKLTKVENQSEIWGEQILVNADDEVEGEYPWLLVLASEMSLSEVAQTVHGHGGLFIPAHVDRAGSSLQSQLGFLPVLPYDALEVLNPASEWLALMAKTHRGPLPTLIRNSDAHDLASMGRRGFWFKAEKPDFEGLKNALHSGAVSLIPPQQAS